MSAQLIAELRKEAREAKAHGAFSIAQRIDDAATALAVAATDAAHLKRCLAVADRALAFVGDHPRGGVIVDGTPEGDRDAMIGVARQARKTLKRLLP